MRHLRVIAVLLAAVLMLASFAPALAEAYTIQARTVYRVVLDYWLDKDGGRNNAIDTIPDFFPEAHAVRLFQGAWLEVPVRVYLYFDKDQNVYWIVDYCRLRDVKATMDPFNYEKIKLNRQNWSRLPDLFRQGNDYAKIRRETFPMVEGDKRVTYQYVEDAGLLYLRTGELKEDILKRFNVSFESDEVITLQDKKTSQFYRLTKTKLN